MVEAPLRVAVDATPLLHTLTGVGVFTEALLAGIGRRPEIDATAFPVSLRGRTGLRDVVPDGVAVRSPPLPAVAVPRGLATLRTSPRSTFAIGRHDVVHGPNFVVPPSRAARVMTVHDLTAAPVPRAVRTRRRSPTPTSSGARPTRAPGCTPTAKRSGPRWSMSWDSTLTGW